MQIKKVKNISATLTNNNKKHLVVIKSATTVK